MSDGNPSNDSQKIIKLLSDDMVGNKEFSTPEAKKRVKDYDAEMIYAYVKKYGIENINLSNLQKLHEKELLNVPFFQKLRKIFNPRMIKSKLMETLGISKSYTGFHEYIKGDREDIPTTGLCNIAKKVNHSILILPIPDDITPEEYRRLEIYRTNFIFAVDDLIKNGSVPCTRAKSKKSDPERYINNELLDSLALTSEDIMKLEIGNVEVNDEDKIGEDEVFIDTTDPINFNIVNVNVEQMDQDQIDSFGKINQDVTIPNNIGEFDKFDEFEDLYNLTDMGQYDDSLGDFKIHSDEDDEFTAMEKED